MITIHRETRLLEHVVLSNYQILGYRCQYNTTWAQAYLENYGPLRLGLWTPTNKVVVRDTNLHRGKQVASFLLAIRLLVETALKP